MDPQANTPATIDEYISRFPVEIQDKMNAVRLVIHYIVPGVGEKISWGMPTFFVNNMRIHFAGNKSHLGLYPGSEVVEVFKKELTPYKTSKGAVQFPYTETLPSDLVAEIVKFVFKQKS